MTNPSEQTAGGDELTQLEARINSILPPRYVGCFDEVSPAPMGSAKLKYDAQGRVDWGEIWTSFCHLALAGGPTHRGQLLEPVSPAEANADPAKQREVTAEIERAIRLTTPLYTVRSPLPGWVAVRCDDDDMAAWLQRAIVAENVSARRDGQLLLLPVGPQFRLEREMKNVIVSLAKTCHYLVEHVEPDERPKGLAGPLIEPATAEEIAASPEAYQQAVAELQRGLAEQQFDVVDCKSAGWSGVQLASEDMAVWMCRAIVIDNILVRREGATLLLPVSLGAGAATDCQKILTTIAAAGRLWSQAKARE